MPSHTTPYDLTKLRARVSHLAAGTAAAVLLVPVAAVAGTTGAGAEGIGDPYFPDYGNGGYDVSHYDVEVEVAGDTVSGTTTITATATERLTQFNLDFVLDTTAVVVNGEVADFTKPSTHELVVTPSEAIPNGDTMTVEVTYSDEPGSVFDRGNNPVYTTGTNGLLILGEPESAPWWIPGNDHPRDKATYDVAITVADGVEALTIGRLVGVEDGAKDTWTWAVNQPTTGYLLFLAAGQYDVTESTIAGEPAVTAIGAGAGVAGEAAAEDFERMDEVVDFLESEFGDYRFDVLGNVVPNTSLGFALETQTRPVYSTAFWSGGFSNMDVVVHEWAHQWVGDNVSVHSWRDIWMNEGFASWAPWKWEQEEGGDTLDEIFLAYYNSHPSSDPFWNLHIGDPGPNSLFAGEVYDRGAMTVQALRNRISKSDHKTLLKKWQNKHEYDDAGTKKFIKLAEKVSGEDLTTFFDAWLYSSDKPPATDEYGVPPGPVDIADVESFDRLKAATEMLVEAEAAAHGR